ncbi:hypothetical protein B0H19DRAFT_1133726, partial [Mycena capillaripes]
MLLYLGFSKLAVAQGSWLLWVVSNFSAQLALTGIVTTIFVPNQSSEAAPFVAVACGDYHFPLASISGSSDPSRRNNSNSRRNVSDVLWKLLFSRCRLGLL